MNDAPYSFLDFLKYARQLLMGDLLGFLPISTTLLTVGDIRMLCHSKLDSYFINFFEKGIYLICNFSRQE